jgi:hypothetical protein
LLQVCGDYALLLLVQMLACLPQSLGDGNETVNRAVFLRLQLRSYLLSCLFGDVCRGLLSLVEDWAYRLLGLVNNARAVGGGFARRTRNRAFWRSGRHLFILS